MLRNLLPRLRVIAAARASSPSIPLFYGTLSSPPPPQQDRTSVEHLEDDDDDGSGGVTRPSASTISIDRSGLYNPQEHSHGPSLDSELTKHLKGIIKFRGGPISVAEYMEEVLTNPRVGFYMNRDVFGAGGDFVTSPEVSQMFGEMIGVWTMCLWEQMGQPKRVNLVELGPGRGTLMADLLRGAWKFKHFTQSLQIHMVECSPTLRKLQHQTLKCIDEESVEKKTISSLAGSPVSWHANLDEVPSGVPTIIVAHEFYDALPVHQFQDFSWLVRENGGYPRRFIVSILFTSRPVFHVPCIVWNPINQRKPFFLCLLDQEVFGINHMEICPKAMDLTQTIAKRIGSDGGGALIIDYGLNKLVSDSLQAIRKHKFVHILDDPGSADLSAYVDFAAIRHSAEEVSDDVSVHGPITQSQLLGALGINFRVEALLENCNEEQAESLRTGYWRLVGDGEAPFWEGPDEQVPMGMGTRYLAMAIVNKSHGVPVPFT